MNQKELTKLREEVRKEVHKKILFRQEDKIIDLALTKGADEVLKEIEKHLTLSSFDPLDPDNTEVLRIDGIKWKEIKAKFKGDEA